MSDPHRITFLATASTTIDVPDTGQGREEAIDSAYADLDTGLCWQCASRVDLGDFEVEEHQYDPSAEMRATLDAIRDLATRWVNHPNPSQAPASIRWQIEDGRELLAILDGEAVRDGK